MHLSSSLAKSPMPTLCLYLYLYRSLSNQINSFHIHLHSMLYVYSYIWKCSLVIVVFQYPFNDSLLPFNAFTVCFPSLPSLFNAWMSNCKFPFHPLKSVFYRLSWPPSWILYVLHGQMLVTFDMLLSTLDTTINDREILCSNYFKSNHILQSTN